MVVLLSLLAAAAAGTAVPDCAQVTRNGNWKAAEECYTAALQRNPDSRTLRAAVLVYRKALASGGPSRDRVYNLALALFRIGEGKESLALLDQYPDWNAERYALAGAAWRLTGDLVRALAALRQATSLEPNHEEYRCDYVLTLLRAGQEAEAAAQLDRAVVQFPRSARVQGALGLLAFGRGDFPGAIARYRRAVEFEPGAAEMHASLGDVYAAAGELGKAASTYATAIRLSPQDGSYLVKRGRCLLRLQRQQEAVIDLKKAVQLDPQDFEAHFELGKLAASASDDPAALLHLEKAARSPNAPPEAFYQLSRLYRRVGRAQDSAAALRRFQERKQEMQESGNEVPSR